MPILVFGSVSSLKTENKFDTFPFVRKRSSRVI